MAPCGDDRRRRRGADRHAVARRAVLPDAQRGLAAPPRDLRPLALRTGRPDPRAAHGTGFRPLLSQNDRPEDEVPERAPAEGRASREAFRVGLEDVDEPRERTVVAKLGPDDVERHTNQRADARLSAAARDALLDTDQRRQEPARPP